MYALLEVSYSRFHLINYYNIEKEKIIIINNTVKG